MLSTAIAIQHTLKTNEFDQEMPQPQTNPWHC